MGGTGLIWDSAGLPHPVSGEDEPVGSSQPGRLRLRTEFAAVLW